MMRYLFAFLVLLLLSSSANAQWVPVCMFEYDLAGNRVLRYMTEICIECPPKEEQKQLQSISQDNHNDQFGLSNSANDVVAYPNPVDKLLYVEYKQWQSDVKASIFVYDMNGKMLQQRRVASMKEEISFSNYAAGAYQLQYWVDDKMLKVWKINKISEF